MTHRHGAHSSKVMRAFDLRMTGRIKALVLTACDLFDKVQLLEAARREFEERGRHLEKKA